MRQNGRLLQNLNINFDRDDFIAVLSSFDELGFSGKAPVVTRYERVIAEYFNSDFALPCCNGTVAIELGLRALGVKAGQSVALPPTAPIMTILPILTMGCRPVFYDVDEEDFSPRVSDLDEIRKFDVKVVITVPMWGYPYNPLPVREFCDRHSIGLLEDCAHSFGVSVGGKKLGTFGDVAAFSTHERKLVSTGEGGFCLARGKLLYDRMKSWQHHGLSIESDSSEYVLGKGIGTNFKISPLCAALGIEQFRKLDSKIAARRSRVAQLRQKLEPCGSIRELRRFGGEEINGYSMVFKADDVSELKQKIGKLAAVGILSDTLRYKYKPLYCEPAFATFRRICPNAEILINSIFTIPCHEGLSGEDIDHITESVRRLFN